MVNVDKENAHKPQLSPLESGIAGAVSGFMTRAVLQPLDVLKIRFQLQVEPLRKKKGGLYQGIFHAVKKIISQEGKTALWKGHISAQALTVAYGLGQFWSYTFFKQEAKSSGLENGVVLTICGGLAGTVGTFVSMPFDVARTRIVAQSIPEYKGTMDVWRKIIRKENAFGLWKGLTPTILMTAPFAAIQFRMYYFLSDLMSQEYFRKANFFGSEVSKTSICGAISGVFAKVAVYPLDVLKKRMQIRGSETVRQKFGKVVVYTSLLDCIRRVTIEEGVLAWFKGLKPSLIKSGAFSALVFTFYETTCDAILTVKEKR